MNLYFLVLLLLHFRVNAQTDTVLSIESLIESAKRYLRVRNLKLSSDKRLQGIHVLPIPSDISADIDPSWGIVEIPSKSYFAGFSPPNDTVKWKIAQLQASRGEQILLEKLLNAVRSPFDLIQTDINFKWLHKFAEYQQSEKNFDMLEGIRTGQRAPVTMFGYNTFDRDIGEGNLAHFFSLNPAYIVKTKEFQVPKKVVAIGMFNENWGWLSTYFLNRTVHWGRVFQGEENPYKPGYRPPIEQIRNFLDNPNIVMMVVNGHHNCSHPKVISMPLGIAANPKEFWSNIQRAVRKGVKKEYVLYSAG